MDTISDSSKSCSYVRRLYLDLRHLKKLDNALLSDRNWPIKAQLKRLILPAVATSLAGCRMPEDKF